MFYAQKLSIQIKDIRILIYNCCKKMKKKISKEQEKVDSLDLNTLIILTRDLLSDLIEEESCDCVSIFNSRAKPSITIDTYLRRIQKYTCYSPQSLIIAIIYIDRYNIAESEFSINEYNVHRILLGCLLLAVKFQDDIYFDNTAFEKAGGVTLKELCNFQLEIFTKLQYNTFVSEQQYLTLLTNLKSVYLNQQ